MTSNILFALGLTIFAGLSTGIGSLIGFLSKKFNPKFLAGSLGFSAGVMIYVSMIEIFFKAKDSLSLVFGEKQGYIYTVIAFFTGIALIALIDKLIPSAENPHEPKNMECPECLQETEEEKKQSKLMRMGLFSALALGIHNFPEGLATFMGGLADPTLGVSIAVAIAIHNIPEGLAVSHPSSMPPKAAEKPSSILSSLASPSPSAR